MAQISPERFQRIRHAINAGTVMVYHLADDALAELMARPDPMPGENLFEGLSPNARLLLREVDLFLDEPDTTPPAISYADIIAAQQALFERYGTVFRTLSGQTHKRSTESSSALESRTAQRLGKRSIANAVQSALEDLADFYADMGPTLRAHCRQIGGIKVLINKGTSFEPPVIRGIRKLGLYVDTHILPDPFSPLALEVRERGLHGVGGIASLATALRRMLQLEPLVSACHPPALVVFPSRLNHWRTLYPDTPEGVDSLRLKGLTRALVLREPTDEAFERACRLDSVHVMRRLFQTGVLPTNGFDPRQQLVLCNEALRMKWRQDVRFRDRPYQHYLINTT